MRVWNWLYIKELLDSVVGHVLCDLFDLWLMLLVDVQSLQ